MKKQIGNTLALYPTPLVVVGAMINGKPNWLLVGHLGIIGHDRVMVSLAKPHYTNQGIKASRALSINIVDEALLPKPVLFGMPTYEYLRTGKVIGKCMSFGTQEKRTEGDHQND